MNSSETSGTPQNAFSLCFSQLEELEGELTRALDGLQIDSIVNRATQSFQTAFDSIQGEKRDEFSSSRLSTTLYSPLQVSIQSIEEVSAKRFQAQWMIQNLRRGCDDILTKLIIQGDSEPLKEIGQLFEPVRTLIATTQERVEALSKQQEMIREKFRLLQEKKEILTAFQQQCGEFSQIFAEMCERANSVDSDLTTSSSRVEQSGRRVSLSAQDVSGVVQDLTRHLEEISRVESELQTFSTQSAQYGLDVDQNCGAVSGLETDISQLQSGFTALKTSMAEIQHELAVHQQQASGSVANPPNPELNPTASAPPSDGNLTLVQRLFIWTLKAIFWSKEAYDHTTLELSLVLNNASQWTKHQITPYVGVYQATIITNTKLWVATVLFILYWKGVLRKATGCYMLGCAIFHARSRPMVENQANT